jgi:type III pantothenate kinase
MKLILDIGNSFSKMAVFDGEEMIDLQVREDISVEQIQNQLDEHRGIKSAILSNVRNSDKKFAELFKNLEFFIELNHTVPVPFKNIYRSPETLGKDRIAAVAAASKIFPGQNVLIIDAGTCITYDLLNRRNEYIGGAISPGITMRYKALNHFTGKLPLVEASLNSEPNPVGDSTSGSITSGVQLAIILEVEGMIAQYSLLFPELKVIVSGGDYFYFDKYLKSNIFATPNIVLKGLKEILDFNEDNNN